MEKVIVQKLKKEAPDVYSLAELYVSLISATNSLSLTKREIQLVAFTAIHGNISYNVNREEFCKRYSTSSPTINNMISKLKKIGILIKSSGKIKTHPLLVLDFNKDIILNITLSHGQASLPLG